MEKYQEILEKYEINSLERFNKLFESKDPLDKYVAFIQKEPIGNIIDVYNLEQSSWNIKEDLVMKDRWILPLRQSADFQKSYPVPKGYCIDKTDEPEIYNFLKENGCLD